MAVSETSVVKQRPPLSLTHFGAAGWSITDGRTTVLLDPYLSRIRFKGRKYGPHDATEVPGDQRPIVYVPCQNQIQPDRNQYGREARYATDRPTKYEHSFQRPLCPPCRVTTLAGHPLRRCLRCA